MSRSCAARSSSSRSASSRRCSPRSRRARRCRIRRHSRTCCMAPRCNVPTEWRSIWFPPRSIESARRRRSRRSSSAHCFHNCALSRRNLCEVQLMRWSSWTLVFAIAVVSTTAFAGNDKQHATKKEPAKKAPPPATTNGSAADGSSDEAPPSPEAQADALGPNIKGPKLVDLGHGAEIDLPAGMFLYESAGAQDLMRKLGNSPAGTLAAIVPRDFEKSTWMIVIDADDSGYVNDSDADDLAATSMLNDFKAGTEEQNKKRAAKGIAAMTID